MMTNLQILYRNLRQLEFSYLSEEERIKRFKYICHTDNKYHKKSRFTALTELNIYFCEERDNVDPHISIVGSAPIDKQIVGQFMYITKYTKFLLPDEDTESDLAFIPTEVACYKLKVAFNSYILLKEKDFGIKWFAS